MELSEQDERNIVDLLTDQVEFANVIVINKLDLVATGQVQALDAILQRLNPNATILHAENSLIPLNSILNTGLFDIENAEAMQG